MLHFVTHPAPTTTISSTSAPMVSQTLTVLTKIKSSIIPNPETNHHLVNSETRGDWKRLKGRDGRGLRSGADNIRKPGSIMSRAGLIHRSKGSHSWASIVLARWQKMGMITWGWARRGCRVRSGLRRGMGGWCSFSRVCSPLPLR